MAKKEIAKKSKEKVVVKKEVTKPNVETPEVKLKEISVDVSKQVAIAKKIVITKAEDVVKATEFVAIVKGRLNRIIELETFFTEPYVEQRRVALAEKQKIEALFAEQKAPLLEIEATIKKGISTFKLAEEEKARKEEARLQKIRDDANAKREDKGIAPIETPVASVDRTDQTIKTDAGSSTAKKVWKARLVNINLVPREYLRCELNVSKVNFDLSMGVRKIDGLEIYEDFDISIKASKA